MTKSWHFAVAFIGLQLLLPSNAFVPFSCMASPRADRMSVQPLPNPYSSELQPMGFRVTADSINLKYSASFASSLNQYPSPASFMATMHDNGSFVLSVVLWLSATGVSLERRTTVGKALSAPLATMALALGAANVGVLPFKSPICKLRCKVRFPLNTESPSYS